MASVDAPATTHDEVHDDHHHEHGEFIAHHFDTPQQQYDSGKLGIWVFLVTEVLFFSGLFVAYILYRYHRPELFVEAHVFLDKVLGGINTVVLLFSSLTMAWAVRAAQLGQNKFAAKLVLITAVCGSMFLGIKAVEYSHKWDLNIWVISHFDYVEGYHPTHEGGLAGALNISPYLVAISIIPAIAMVGFAIAAVVLRAMEKKLLSTFLVGLTIVAAGYFLGAVGGQLYMLATEGGTGNQSHAAAGAHGHAGEEHASAESSGAAVTGPSEKYPPDVGIFFSIYYCMTGLHAIHVLGGIVALSWLLYRSLALHWRSDYFGPVDNVGLYWHLVDLIWIFLFPLLYLIK